jgi:predicted esterase
MSNSLSRAVRRAGFVCLAVLSLSTISRGHAAAKTSPAVEGALRAHVVERSANVIEKTSRGHHSSAPVTLHAEGRSILAFAPPPMSGESGEKPITLLYLHGAHGRAENGCPWFRAGAADLGWLVCPEGAVREESGSASWGGDVFEQSAVVSRALRAAEEHGASSEPGVVVGFSQGSYVALDLVKTHLGHFRGLVLLAAPEAHPSAQRLRDAGIERVALGAGSLDAAYAPLVEDTKRLVREGMDARFFDLGHVGHTYAAEDPEVLREAIAWAAQRDKP